MKAQFFLGFVISSVMGLVAYHGYNSMMAKAYGLKICEDLVWDKFSVQDLHDFYDIKTATSVMSNRQVQAYIDYQVMQCYREKISDL